MVESERVPGKGRIRTRIEKLSRRVREKGRISVSTENERIRASTGKKVESVQVLKKCPDEYRKRVDLV